MFSDGDKVIVAVKKQANVEPMLVTFPENVLLGVAPPASQAEHYALPEEIIEDGLSSDYPMFDGAVCCISTLLRLRIFLYTVYIYIYIFASDISTHSFKFVLIKNILPVQIFFLVEVIG